MVNGVFIADGESIAHNVPGDIPCRKLLHFYADDLLSFPGPLFGDGVFALVENFPNPYITFVQCVHLMAENQK